MENFDYREWEFKYVSEPAITIQKLLNQWRHQYNLRIIVSRIVTSAISNNIVYIEILIARKEIS
jgi:hypothetical protein